jgi:hypothetical protein
MNQTKNVANRQSLAQCDLLKDVVNLIRDSLNLRSLCYLFGFLAVYCLSGFIVLFGNYFGAPFPS